MYEVGAGFTIANKKPILNENIFYDYEIDKKPFKIEEWKDNSVPLDKFIRENTGYKTIGSLDGEGIKLVGIGLIVIIVVNLFRK